LSILGLLPLPPASPYKSHTFLIRMRAFLDVAMPPPPTETALAAANVPEVSDPTDIAALLNHCSTKAADAQKAWDILSKATPEFARCLGSEARYITKCKNVVRSAIMTSIAVRFVREWVKDGKKEGGLQVELEFEKSYDDWWVVPKVVARK
jgi:hypothetical protein